MFEAHPYNRPTISLSCHPIAVVADGRQKGAADSFEVFHIVTVLDDVHGAHVEKLDLGSKAVVAVGMLFHEVPCVGEGKAGGGRYRFFRRPFHSKSYKN